MEASHRQLSTTAGTSSANEELRYIFPESPHIPVKATNEIAYADDAGEMQFLRRSLLAGTFKFDQQESQVLPMRLLDCFRSYLNYVSDLICIGYGFGDMHINQIMREWLEFSADRRIEVVGPSANSTPAFLLHLAPQVRLTQCTAADYLERLLPMPLSSEEKALKAIWSSARARQYRR